MFEPSEGMRERLLPRRGAVAVRTLRSAALVADLDAVLAEQDETPSHLWSRAIGWARSLRPLLASADDESYDAARAWTETKRAEGTLTRRAFLAFLFDAEPAWAEADLSEALGQSPVAPGVALALATARDAALVKDAGIAVLAVSGDALAEVVLEVAYTLSASPETAVEILLAWLAELEPRARAQLAPQRHGARRAMLAIEEVLACIADPSAAQHVASRLSTAEGRKHAARYAKRFPALAAAALTPLASGRGKSAEHAKALLRTLAPSLDESAVTADVAAKVDELSHDPAASLPIAPAHAVPAILRDPPWRRWKSAGLPVIDEPPSPDFDLPAAAAAKHDRDAWAAKLPSIPRQAILSSRAAFPVAHAWLQRKAERAAAEAWMRTFAPIALYGVFSYALGPAGPSRLLATSALRFLWAEVGAERADKIVERWAEDARLAPTEIVRAMHAILEADPRFECPDRAPSWPSFLPRASLPAVRLRDRDERLPDDARDHLVEMITFAAEAVGGGDLVRVYAGVADVRDALDASSLEDFSWAIHDAWAAQGSNVRSTWPLDQLALFGGARTARELAARVRALVTEKAFERAKSALLVLARIDDEAALVQLGKLAATSRSEPIRRSATELLEAAAKARGVEDLEDLLVPDLGLDEDGGLTLDFGAPGRTFRVGFDERLVPLVRDASGSLLTTLPKPRKTDDAAMAEAAHETWRGLRDDAQTAARALLAQLEKAMCTERRWSPAAFDAKLARHRLVRHLASRLVWAAHDASGAMRATFRVAEDGSFASIDDEPFELSAGDEVRLPHALALDEATRVAWSERLADYELLQPFPQLAREVFAFEASERSTRSSDRFLGREVDGPRFFALELRGWSRDEGALVTEYRRKLSVGRVRLSLTSPFEPRDPRQPVALGSISCVEAGRTLGELTPIEASELLRDVSYLVN